MWHKNKHHLRQQKINEILENPDLLNLASQVLFKATRLTFLKKHMLVKLTKS